MIDEAPSQPEVKPPHVFKRLHSLLHRHPLTGLVTKIVVTIIGTAVILVGVVLSGPGVPGPGLVVIVFGLAILSTEWVWAERLLQRARRWLEKTREKVRDMDPAVRRRRVVAGAIAVVVVVGGVAAYLVLYDWPDFAVDGWDWLQDINGAVPELPGM